MYSGVLLPGDMNSGWVHVNNSSGENRKEVLTYSKEKGYAKGLVI